MLLKLQNVLRIEMKKKKKKKKKRREKQKSEKAYCMVWN